MLIFLIQKAQKTLDLCVSGAKAKKLNSYEIY